MFATIDLLNILQNGLPENLVFRRFDGEFPLGALLVPVVLAWVIYFLIVFYRQPDSLNKLLGVLRIPSVVLNVLWIFWGISLFSFVSLTTVLAFSNQWELIHPQLWLINTMWLAGYLGLVCLIAFVIIHVRQPWFLIPTVFHLLITGVYIGFASVRQFQNWITVLIAVLSLALVYVIMMYARDARTANPVWALFLGLLRCAVYAALTIAFLLPALQEYDTRLIEPELIVLLDVSASTLNQDKSPGMEEGKQKIPSRQEQIIEMLSQKKPAKGKWAGSRQGQELTFLEHLQLKMPAKVYQFGGQANDKNVLSFPGGDQFKTMSKKDWQEFMKVDPANIAVPEKRNGKPLSQEEKDDLEREYKNLYANLLNQTNIEASTLDALRNESGHQIQSVIIISDGRKTVPSSPALTTDLEQMTRGALPPHIITVGVGDYVPPITIDIDDLAAPQQAQPGDAFPVRVPVFGEQFPGQEFTVDLAIFRADKEGETYKTRDNVFLFKVPLGPEDELDAGEIPESLTRTFQNKGKELSENASVFVVNPTTRWQIASERQWYLVEKDEKQLNISLQKAKFLTKQGVFKGGKEPTVLEFEINVRELAGLDSKDDSKDDTSKIKGYWQFQARVPRIPGESFDKEHISKPVHTFVQSRPLRDLLFAGGPSREYQFVRTLFYRESLKEGKMELAVLLQNAPEKEVNQDVPKERLLTEFPSRLGKGTSTKPFSSLSEFDVIIAFDPDWSKLKASQIKNLERWVGGVDAGGFVLVAGPINTYQLARPGGLPIKELITMCPVKLRDNRLINLGIGHKANKPYPLEFEPEAEEYDFLRLSEEDKSVKQIWGEYFWEGPPPAPGKLQEPERGFFTYYPVEEARPGTNVLARFVGTPSSRIKSITGEEVNQPFIAVMPYYSGKFVFLGSGEFYFLRQFDETYYQRFWLKLARFAAGDNLSKLNRKGRILMKSRAPAGYVPIEAQILGADEQPLDKSSKPVVKVYLLDEKGDETELEDQEFTLDPSLGGEEWNGYFTGFFRARDKGRYALKIPIPGTSNTLTHEITIFQKDPERDEPKEDHEYLKKLADSADSLLSDLPAEKADLLRPKLGQFQETGETKLFVELPDLWSVADLISPAESEVEKTKLRTEDLWDKGWKGESISSRDVLLLAFVIVGYFAFMTLIYYLLFDRGLGNLLVSGLLTLAGISGLITTLLLDQSGRVQWAQIPLYITGYNFLLYFPTSLALVAAVIFGLLRQYISALVTLGLAVIYAVTLWIINRQMQPNWEVLPLEMSFGFAIVVSLLSLEWLTRKLLRLA